MTSLVLQKHTHDNITQIGRKNGTSVTGIFAGILAMLASRYNQVPQARSVSIWGVATDRRARIPERYKPFYSQAIWSKSIRLTNMNEIRAAERAMLEDGHVTNEFWNICHEFKQDLDIFAVTVKSSSHMYKFDDESTAER